MAHRQPDDDLRLAHFSMTMSRDIILWLTEDGRLHNVNDAACKNLGYSRDELQSMSIWELDPGQSRASFKALWRNIMTDGSRTFETTIRTRDGRLLPVEVDATYISFSDRAYNFVLIRDIRERKRAENELQASERFLDSVFEGIQEGICILDRDMTIVRTNRTMEKWYAHMLPLAGKKCYQAYHGRNGPCENCPSRRAMEEKAMKTSVVPLVNASGTAGWIELYSSPLEDERGNVVGVIEHVRDITERKRVDEALRESERKFRAIFDQTYQLMGLMNPDGTLVEVNRSALTLAGKEERMVVGRPFWDTPWWTHSPELQEQLRQAVKQAAGGEFVRFEATHPAADGSLRHIDFSIKPVKDEAGRVILLIPDGRDITERKLAEEALQESEERLRLCAAMARFGTFDWDLVRDRHVWSPETYEIYGVPPDTPLTLDYVMSFIYPGDRQDDVLAAGLDPAGPGEYAMEYRIRRASDGAIRWVYMRTHVIFAGEGTDRHAIRVLGAIQDVTEHKLAEEALTEAKVRAELYVDLMGHDINNMHQVALGYLELAIGMAGEEQKELLCRPVDVLQRSTRLIRNVRKLQMLQDRTIRDHVVDLCDVLTRLRQEFGAVPGKTIALEMNGLTHCPVRANELLDDVFSNLVSNAIKHTGDRADIVVDLDIVEDNSRRYCRVMVEDNGPGIPDDFKGMIFNRMLRGDTMAKGMGLGLYLVKSLVDSYDGRVWVEDRIAGDHTKGARFVVRLPTAG